MRNDPGAMECITRSHIVKRHNHLSSRKTPRNLLAFGLLNANRSLHLSIISNIFAVTGASSNCRVVTLLNFYPKRFFVAEVRLELTTSRLSVGWSIHGPFWSCQCYSIKTFYPLLPLTILRSWTVMDLNHRASYRPGLQPGAFNHSANCPSCKMSNKIFARFPWTAIYF